MKDKIKTIIYIFSLIVTAIFLIDSIFLLIFKGKEAFLSVYDILFILLDAFICAVCYLPLLSDKGFSKAKMILMQIGYFVVINTIVILTGIFLKWFCFDNPGSFLKLEAVIVISYILVMVSAYRIDSTTAQKLNQKLQELE